MDKINKSKIQQKRIRITEKRNAVSPCDLITYYKDSENVVDVNYGLVQAHSFLYFSFSFHSHNSLSSHHSL